MAKTGEVHMILVTPGDDGGSYFCVSGPEFTDYFGIPCVKGNGIAGDAAHWINGTTVFVPLSRINCVITYDSVAEYQAAADRYKSANETVPRSPGQPPAKKKWYRF